MSDNTSSSALVTHVRSAKSYYEKYLDEAGSPEKVSTRELNIVMGNEGCDLDSFACALSWSYYLDAKKHHSNKAHEVLAKIRHMTKISSKKHDPVIPLCCTTLEMFQIRGDCMCLCEKLDLCPERDIVFVDMFQDLVEKYYQKGTKLKIEISLVDQYSIPAEFKNWLMEKSDHVSFEVKEIVDHHKRSKELEHTVKKDKLIDVMSECGSNATNVAIQYKELADKHEKSRNGIIPKSVAISLLMAILIDTSNLQEGNGKTTKYDIDIAEWLVKRIKEKDENGKVYTEDLESSCDNCKYIGDLISLEDPEVKVRVHSDVNAEKKNRDKYKITSSMTLEIDAKIYELQDGRTKETTEPYDLYGISVISSSHEEWKELVCQADAKETVYCTAMHQVIFDYMKSHNLLIFFIIFFSKCEQKKRRQLACYFTRGIYDRFVKKIDGKRPDKESGKYIGENIDVIMGKDLLNQLKMSLLSGAPSVEDKKGEIDILFRMYEQGEVQYSRKKLQPLLHKRLCELSQGSS